MNAKLFISKTEIALDFECERDRDIFFKNMAENSSGGFNPQEAAEKVGSRTIRFHQSEFLIGWVWSVVFPDK